MAHYFHVRPVASTPEAAVPSSAFTMQDGFFLRVCAEAVNDPDADFVVLLDEFNRCNVPKVMGDLLTTLERSKRAKWTRGAWDLSSCQVVTLPGSKRLFFVPDNVYVVACMNTTDRSVAPLDAALRRRFAFHRLWPKGFDPSAPMEAEKVANDLWAVDNSHFKDAVALWHAVNKALEKSGPDALLGHSYLYDLADDLKPRPESDAQKPQVVVDPKVMLKHHWDDHILPQLAEVLTANNISWDSFCKKFNGKSSDRVVRSGNWAIKDHTPKEASGFLRIPMLYLDSGETPENGPVPAHPEGSTPDSKD